MGIQLRHSVSWHMQGVTDLMSIKPSGEAGGEAAECERTSDVCPRDPSLPHLGLGAWKLIEDPTAGSLELSDSLLWIQVLVEAYNRGLLLPLPLKKFFFKNYTQLTSPAHSQTTWCWWSELWLWKRTNCAQGTKGESKFISPEPYLSVKDVVGGWKERSREGVKKKEWEADTGVNPLSGSSWLQFIFPLEMLSFLLLLVQELSTAREPVHGSLRGGGEEILSSENFWTICFISSTQDILRLQEALRDLSKRGKIIFSGLSGH